MAHRTRLTFSYADARRAARVAAAVEPEVGAIEGERTSATLDREGDAVTVTVEATDLVGLRAGVNTWCRLVSVAEASAGA